ncbi:response regulator [Marispirochaeta sp.]|jgi:CheY-like chemotaxis protein|uniref:response regulator n=1 Tax=Marispirochaeta sp. TaxID=2038653 RepID=UPI0029C6A3E4|nr:response regulator [Marispirochaeta sp.]
MDQKHVLIVEDEFIVAVDLRGTLERRGFSVAGIINTGIGAVEFIRKNGKADCILMDVSLKGEITGIEAAAEIHKECPVPVIFLTAHNTLPGVQAGIQEPLCRLVAKPFDEQELIRVIETLIQETRSECYE